MSDDEEDRLTTELSLLESIYPDAVTYNSARQELTYTLGTSKLILRLPDGYPSTALPEVLSANAGSQDVRSQVKAQIGTLSVGEECLDAIVAGFGELVGELYDADATESADGKNESESGNGTELEESISTPASVASKTVIIWLHHLLNTSKRKQALASSDPAISGISKPGYPGVLVFSGSARNVTEHVDALKGLNWAAFQVRYEEEGDEGWGFEHGRGVVEVESMRDVVREIGVGEGRKEFFLEAMRMK